MPGFTTGYQYLDDRYGVDLMPGEAPENTVMVSSGALRILKPDPARIAFLITNPATGNVFLWNDSTVSTTKGILLGGNGASLFFSIEEDLDLPMREWFGIADSTTSALSVISWNIVAAKKEIPRAR